MKRLFEAVDHRHVRVVEFLTLGQPPIEGHLRVQRAPQSVAQQGGCLNQLVLIDACLNP